MHVIPRHRIHGIPLVVRLALMLSPAEPPVNGQPCQLGEDQHGHSRLAKPIVAAAPLEPEWLRQRVLDVTAVNQCYWRGLSAVGVLQKGEESGCLR